MYYTSEKADFIEVILCNSIMQSAWHFMTLQILPWADNARETFCSRINLGYTRIRKRYIRSLQFAMVSWLYRLSWLNTTLAQLKSCEFIVIYYISLTFPPISSPLKQVVPVEGPTQRLWMMWRIWGLRHQGETNSPWVMVSRRRWGGSKEIKKAKKLGGNRRKRPPMLHIDAARLAQSAAKGYAKNHTESQNHRIN